MNENQLTTEAIGQRFLINLNTEWFKRCTLEQQTTINNNTEFNSQVFRFNSVLSLARDNICLHYPGHSNNKTTKFDTEISRFFMSASHLSVKHFKHKQHLPPFFSRASVLPRSNVNHTMFLYYFYVHFNSFKESGKVSNCVCNWCFLVVL